MKASKLWDGRVFSVQVTDSDERSLELRVLASAATSGGTFDLRCEVREKLFAFLARDIPEALPRMREEFIDWPMRPAQEMPSARRITPRGCRPRPSGATLDSTFKSLRSFRESVRFRCHFDDRKVPGWGQDEPREPPSVCQAAVKIGKILPPWCHLSN